MTAFLSTASLPNPHFSSTLCEAVLKENTPEKIFMTSSSRKPYSQMRFTARVVVAQFGRLAVNVVLRVQPDVSDILPFEFDGKDLVRLLPETHRDKLLSILNSIG